LFTGFSFADARARRFHAKTPPQSPYPDWQNVVSGRRLMCKAPKMVVFEKFTKTI
jgi:hypothetical protein